MPDPICWISGYDYSYLDDRAMATLCRVPHAVWIDTWFNKEESFFEKNSLPLTTTPTSLRKKILSSSPTVVFTISPECSFDFYQGWIDAGASLVSLPLACDTSRYRKDPPNRDEFSKVELAFVGGYWPYKARQFDRYLRSYQERLTVFGYSRWPYAGYGGKLPIEHESSLYNQARVSPCINEPHVELMGIDLNERVFKVLGSGGAAVTDAVPGYHEWFKTDELLVPSSIDEFHEYVDLLLSDADARDGLANRGCDAVYDRHTYQHRARTLMAQLFPSELAP